MAGLRIQERMGSNAADKSRVRTLSVTPVIPQIRAITQVLQLPLHSLGSFKKDSSTSNDHGKWGPSLDMELQDLERD